jgi:hypothetical protein
VFLGFKVVIFALMTARCLAAETDMATLHGQELNSYLQKYTFLTKPIIRNEIAIQEKMCT